MTEARTHWHATLQAYMTRNREELRKHCAQLRTAMHADAHDDAQVLWNQLEQRLLHHMEAEARFLIPQLARIDLEAARALLADHGRIREHLLELGVESDLHCIREEKAQPFLDQVMRHADLEECLFRRWAHAPVIEHVTAAL